MTCNNLCEFFSPVNLAICGKWYSRNDGFICTSCSKKIKLNPYVSNPAEYLSKRYFYFDLLVSLYDYDSMIKPLIISFKERDRVELADFAAESAYKNIITGLGADMITAVPLSRSKKLSRGYNQSELFAKSLSEYSGLVYRPMLKCRGKRDVQKKMNYSSRFLNIIGRYKPLSNVNCLGKTVLLVDDVVTTGATLNECARIIKKMGANAVFSLTIARVNI